MKAPTIVALILICLLPIIGLLFLQKGSTSTPNQTSVTSPSPTLNVPADAVSAQVVKLQTSKGDITLNLYPADAPNTVRNFVTLGKRGYYNHLTFHRVIKDFVIQGGDPSGNGSGGESIYGPTFPDEINSHKIVAGTLAMANAGPNTNGSQFFIVTESAQPDLDGHYTVFGQVADDASMAVVRAIAAVKTDANDKPLDPVTINAFQIIK